MTNAMGDFSRRYGSGSRLLQRPLFYKPYIKCHNSKCIHYRERCEELEQQYSASTSQVCKLEKVAEEYLQESNSTKQQLSKVQHKLEQQKVAQQTQMQQIKELEMNVATFKQEQSQSTKLMQENSRLQREQKILTEEYVRSREVQDILTQENTNLKQEYSALEHEKNRTEEERMKIALKQKDLELKVKLHETQNSLAFKLPYKQEVLPLTISTTQTPN